jgi:hypothetical protein
MRIACTKGTGSTRIAWLTCIVPVFLLVTASVATGQSVTVDSWLVLGPFPAPLPAVEFVLASFRV